MFYHVKIACYQSRLGEFATSLIHEFEYRTNTRIHNVALPLSCRRTPLTQRIPPVLRFPLTHRILPLPPPPQNSTHLERDSRTHPLPKSASLHRLSPTPPLPNLLLTPGHPRPRPALSPGRNSSSPFPC